MRLFKKKGFGESLFFFLLGISLMVYSLINHYLLNTEWKLSPYLFPTLISLFIIALSVSLFFEEHLSTKKEKTDWKTVFKYLIASIIYYFIMPYIGFIISNTLFLIALFYFLGVRRWWKNILLSVGSSVIVYIIFHIFLHVMLP